MGGAASSSRKRRRRVFSPIRSEPRSPSHSMRTRSGRLSAPTSSDLSALAPPSPPALSAIFAFPSHSREAGEKGHPRLRKASANGPGEPFASGSPAPLWFSPGGAQAERGKSRDPRGAEEEQAGKEKDSEKGLEREKGRERDRGREKENQHESRKEKQQQQPRRKPPRGLQGGAAVFSLPRGPRGRPGAREEGAKRPAGRKKSLPARPAAQAPAAAVVVVDSAAALVKSKLPRKGRGPLEKPAPELGPAAAPAEKEGGPLRLPVAAAGPVKHASIGSVLAHADKLPVADRRVASLLKKAKAQLYKIEKSKSLKQAETPKAQGQESDSSETSARGPRIKHVCRRAAVALGRKRAVFPDDLPTLSALPWEEREKILSSMGNDDKSSVAGSEDAEPLAPPPRPVKPMTRNKAPQEPPAKKGRRSRRCGQCPGCQVPEDCGLCTNCLDKPKFGGRNIKKQCCKMRKCQNLQWMPSKAYLQKQAKAVKKKEKKTRSVEKKEAQSGKSQAEPPPKAAPAQPPPAKENHVPRRGPEAARKPSERSEEEEGAPSAPPLPEPPQAPPPAAGRKTAKQPLPLGKSTPAPPTSSAPPQKEAPKTVPGEPRKKPPPPEAEQSKQKKTAPRPSPPVKQKPKEKEKPPPTSKPETGALSALSSVSNGGSGGSSGGGSSSSGKQRPLTDGVHRIRVDFKEDREAERVWESGGLGILTSAPITPRVVCFLCASSGHAEFVYCQVCCEPFHRFCLEDRERPLEDQLENWCCRRCKFCHVCGRQHQATKQLLECNKCRNSYHPECLGPNYPTKPTKRKKVWICTKCVRCKSCGATTPGKGWDAQWSHDFSLCHDCAKLFAKGNFCPLCDKCYDDDDYESKMMQCGRCDRWVHAKCEGLSDEMYEILSNLPESVAYTCVNCTERHPAEWRLALEKELQLSLRQVLAALLSSRTTGHLLRFRQAAKPPDLNPETEESLPSRSSPEGPGPPVLTEVSKQEEQQPLDLEGVKRKMDQGGYASVLEFSDDIIRIVQAAINADGGQPELKKANSMARSFFVRQMERVFPWFSVKKSRFWEPNKVTTNSGLLPNAVLPPSLDHNYAQWQEREESGCALQPPLMKKIIPAPRARGPGEPGSPLPPAAMPPVPSSDRSREDSPELGPPPGVGGDNRQCALCLKYGDDGGNDAGRLLYIGQNEWSHVNCALWSAEVFEEDDGALKNVHVAVIRGKQLRCELCQRPGATVGCCLASCASNYHFMCSRAKSCLFLEDKKVYCQRHREVVQGEAVPETGFEVLRRVFVDLEGVTLRRRFLNGLEPENIHMMIGSMTIDCLGILTDLSDCEDKLFPIGYQCSRVYWSTTDARKRCVYTCKITECRPPASEPDPNGTLEHGSNRTIAHSPGPLSAAAPTREGQAGSVPGSPPPPPPSDLLPHPQSCKALRIRTPTFSPAQRSPGSRPLPSAGSPTPVTHEIVTVGDPLLSSSLRSIGSRRPSAPALSPPQPRPWMLPTVRAGAAPVRPSTPTTASSSPTPVPEPPVGAPAAPRLAVQGSPVPPPPSYPRAAAAGASKGPLSSEGDPLLDAAPPSAQTERGKPAGPRDAGACPGGSARSGPPGLRPASPAPPGGPAGRPPEALPGRPPSKEPPAGFLPSQQPRPTKKDLWDQPGDPEPQAEKTCSHKEGPESPKTSKPAGATHRPPAASDPSAAACGGRERRQKAKKGAKERQGGRPCPPPGPESEEAPPAPPAVAAEPPHPRLSLGAGAAESGQLGPRTAAKAWGPGEGAPSKEPQGPPKRTVKVTLTPLKMEGESQSRGAPPRETEAGPLGTGGQPAAPGPEPGNRTAAQGSPSGALAPEAAPREAYVGVPEGTGRLLQEGGAKAPEEGPYKRRYPRRSARARSNMFFGLTPLYGVRSYGEEDLPFYSSASPGKKQRGKRSAEGQVDGADDLSSTSDEEEEEEEGGGGLYYYNFTRTVVSSAEEEPLAPHGLFREEEEEERLGLPTLSQLDGVDDGTESDASVTLTTAARKANPGAKRSGKENGTEGLKLDRAGGGGGGGGGEKAPPAAVGKASAAHKAAAEAKMDANCRAKAPGQDSLEAQLSSLEAPGRRPRPSTEPPEKPLLDPFGPELLKSDSDNNNSDDCGNILPSDIMDFVLKNTPSMQALGESPESSSSELLTLGEGLGLDGNRAKDMGGLFEVFSGQLPAPEAVDSSVSSSISAEEPFELPLELPSDLSVLTTRSPAVPGQNHGRLAALAGEAALAAPGERALLALPSGETADKRVAVTEKPPSSSSSEGGEPALLSPRGVSSPEGPLTPDSFIQGHMEAEQHIGGSPSCGPGEPGLGAGPDLSRSSGTPGLQVPVSPTLPMQNPKYGGAAPTDPGPGPSQISNAAVQTAPLQLKGAAEKLLVVNQNMQPLYVLQTLPNGLTQKIQLTSAVGAAPPGVMEAGPSLLGPMGSAELALAAGLGPGLNSQPIFPPAGGGGTKGLLRPPPLHSFSAAPQSSFPPALGGPSTGPAASGLLVGVRQPPEPDASRGPDLGPPVSLSKKRPIARLPSRKNRKLAPSDAAPSPAPLGFAPAQLPRHPGLLDLGAVGAAAPHRTVPNIIKRSKPGAVYFEQAARLPLGAGAAAAPPGVAGPEGSHLAPGPGPGLPSALSMVPVQGPAAAAGSAPPGVGPALPGGHMLRRGGSAALGVPGLGPLNSLLIKAAQQSLALPEQQGPPSAPGVFPPLGEASLVQAPSGMAASGASVLPAPQPLGVAPEPEGPCQRGPLSQLLAGSKSGPAAAPPAEGGPVPCFPQPVDAPAPAALDQGKAPSSSSSSSAPRLLPRASSASPGGSPSTELGPASSARAKPRGKRAPPSLDSKGPGKKHKGSPFRTSPPEKPTAQPGTAAALATQEASMRIPASQPLAEENLHSRAHPPPPRAAEPPTSLLEAQQARSAAGQRDPRGSRAPEEEEEEEEEEEGEEEEGTFSSPLMFWLQQEQKRREGLAERRPRRGLVFEISSDDGFQICAGSIEEAWKCLTDKVQEARSNARLKQLSFAGVSGLRMLGVLHDAVVFLLEQLPGARCCHRYRFRFHKPEEAKELPVNPHGSARAELHLRKSAFDMFNFLASKHRQAPEFSPNEEEEEEVQLKSARRATSMDLPMPMRFRHLRKTSKEAVGVYRSPIHGRGLFCKRNIDAGEMVVEYAGIVIRSILTDKREKYYDSKGIGCYMFRIDDAEVVDATMHGNAARFINHSCEPNCYSRVINIDGQKHIVIFAMRKIFRGEELTYDYKFPIEDASNKLPCNCGAKKCRRFLN